MLMIKSSKSVRNTALIGNTTVYASMGHVRQQPFAHSSAIEVVMSPELLPFPCAGRQCGQFQKIGWESKPNREIYTSSKNWNYIHKTIFSFSNHWPSNKNIFFDGIYAKATTKSELPSCLWVFTKYVSPKSRWFQIPHLQNWFLLYHHLLFKDQHVDFSFIFSP